MTAAITTHPSNVRASLVEDQRGAVMLTGVFMACFLIGTLWFLMGIGDAVVFREKMQEAADHGAFSSAALHAKGMNFISLCNLVMLVGTIIHIVLGIISDLRFVMTIITCLSTLGLGCIPAIAQYEQAYRMWDRYFSAMSKAFKAIHIAQQTASYAYPAMGTIEAYEVGAKYGGDKRTSPVNVLALSTSLIPGGAIRGIGKGLGGGGDKPGSLGPDFAASVAKGGLPVETKEFNELCKRVVTVASTGVVNLMGLGSQVSLTKLNGRVLSLFNWIFGAVLEFRYCNKTPMHIEPFGPGWDDFWGEDGPYKVYGAATNGSVWMQVWALNLGPKLHDTSESHVGIAAKELTKYTTEANDAVYAAQAEFYLDCDSDWNAAVCNFEDMATYTIKWRARLRRLELPAITSGIVGATLETVLKMPGSRMLKDGIGDKLSSLFGASGVGKAALNGGVKNIIDQIEKFGKGEGRSGAANLDPKFEQFGVTPFH
ncbi:MAG: hypothetical protein K0S65_2534 [Labilithrix sp.]|nr:hypothetical protein [Labilithrix sp.]